MDIIEYTMHNQNSWTDQPVCDADSLVLCQTAYLNLDGFLGCTLADIWPAAEPDIAHVSPARVELNTRLMQAFGSSARFGGVVIADQINVFDEAASCQFCATLFDLGPYMYLSYRGTDGTLVGWKENLDLLYKDEVAAQEHAQAMLQSCASRYAKLLYVGGHSKGGVLALFAAAFCGADAQDRILAVFSHDGPGLRSDLTFTEGYRRIASRIEKTVPELSIFGMMFNYDAPFRVVQANASGIIQHLPYSWVIEADGSFAVGQGLTQSAKIVRQIVDTMVANMTVEQRYTFVSTVYFALRAADVNKVDEIASMRTLARVISFNRTLPKETKRTLWHLFFQLISVSASAGVDVTKQARNQKRRAKQRAKGMSSDAPLLQAPDDDDECLGVPVDDMPSDDDN